MANAFEFIVKARDQASSVFKDIESEGKSTAGELDRSFKDVATTVGGIGGAAAGGAIFATMDSANVSTGKLQATLGLTKEEAEDLAGTARNVFANNYGDSVGEATRVTGMLRQTLGLTGKDLQTATEDVFKITDAFGDLGAEPEIINENLRVMKAAFPDRSEGEILDMIAAGFQDGAGRSGDLQDSLQEYPRFFSDIGLGGEDMMNFMTTGMDAGARNSDVLGDAVKEMGIIVQETGSDGQLALAEMFGDKQAGELIKNFGKGGEAGRDAFFEILEGLNEIEDPLERNERAVELFGTKGEDLAGVLDDMLPAFLATKDATGEVGDATASLDAQYAGTGNMLEGFKRTFLASTIGPFAEFSGPAGQVLAGVGGMGSAFIGLGGVLGKIPGPMALVSGAQAALNLVMSANPILLIVLALAALAAGLFIAYQKSETFRNIVNGVFNSIMAVVQPVLAWLTENIPAAFQAIIAFVTPILNALWGVIQNWVNNLLVIWEAVWSVIGPVVEQHLEAARVVIATILGFIFDHWETVWNAIKAVLEPIWGGIVGVVTTFIGLVRGAIVPVIDFIRSHWESVWNAIKAFVTPIWDGIKAVVEPAMQAVKSFITGDLGAVRDFWDSSWGGIKDFADTVWNGAGGIVLTIDLAINKAKGFVEDALGGIQEVWETIWGSVSSFVGGIWDSIESTVRGGINNVIGAINSFIRRVNSISVSVPEVDIPGLGSFGGQSLSFPQIPEIPLLAIGGKILQTGLAIVHEGETIVPAEHEPLSSSVGLAGGGGGSGGGTSVIQGALKLPLGSGATNAQRFRLSGLTNELGVDFVFGYLRDGLNQDPPRSVETMVRELEELAAGGEGSRNQRRPGGARIRTTTGGVHIENLNVQTTDSSPQAVAEAVRFALRTMPIPARLLGAR